jgi:hypothetical protein
MEFSDLVMEGNESLCTRIRLEMGDEGMTAAVKETGVGFSWERDDKNCLRRGTLSSMSEISRLSSGM